MLRASASGTSAFATTFGCAKSVTSKLSALGDLPRMHNETEWQSSPAHQDGRADRCGYSRRQWVVEIHHDQAFVCQDIRERAGNCDAPGSGENASGIERQRALEEIIRGVAIEKRANSGTLRMQIGIADDDQALFFIGNVEKSIQQMNGLLLLFRQALAQRIDRSVDGEATATAFFVGT
jgi:hypothetical protein